MKLNLLICVIALVVVGCTPASPQQGDIPTLVGEVTSTGTMQDRSTGSEPFRREDVSALMDALLSFDEAESSAALLEIQELNDPSFIPVMIELMRAARLQIVSLSRYPDYVLTLTQLSGKSFGDDWASWIEWYGGTDLVPPVGFTGWKGRLLGRIDPNFALFLQDDFPSNIRVEEIVWGGVVVDGIPALDQPVMVPVGEADYLNPEELVFGLALNGDARAYPLRILDWHEMANDVVGGIPVSLAYCTLCGAAIAYDGRANDGETYTFGSSGFLFRSNKLMYDRQTRTLWNQLTGEPVLGELVDDDIELEILPVVLTSWENWSNLHPDTLVVDIETGYDRPYLPGAAYGHYFSDEDTMFPVWQRSELLETKDQIYALRMDGIPKAYPIDALVAEGVINDSIGEENLVLVAEQDALVVEGQSMVAGGVTYDAGAEIRAYERGENTFSPGETSGVILDQDGRTWAVTEEALLGPEGQIQERLGGHLAYWFGWYAFFPNTLVYGVE